MIRTEEYTYEYELEKMPYVRQPDYVVQLHELYWYAYDGGDRGEKMMTESEFNRKFRKQMTERGVKIIRIESHTTCPGCPDNHYVGKGFCGWIEMKQEKSMPKRIVYRPQQPVWLHDYWMWGGTAWTFLFVEDENMVVVIPASQTLVASRNLSAAEREEVPLGPAGWIRLARILRTGECVLAV